MASLTSGVATTAKTIKAKKGADQRLKQAQRAAILLKQVSDPTRLQVILMLSKGEKHVGAVCEQLNMSQPAVSHHLALLRHGSIIAPRRHGKNNFYGLTEAGELRKRQSGWHSARRDYPARRISLRGGPGRPVRVVEEETGRLVGTMDEPSAHRFVHDGAVYLHQGESYLVGKLDLDDRVALVECRDPGYSTQARDVTDIDVIAGRRRARWGEADIVFGEVRVTRQVVGYTRVRSESKRREAEVALELPERTLITAAVWWTIPNDLVVPLPGNRLGGAAHAAEHASIGMLPLFATCDRWDVGGLSTEWHPATGQLTVFVYDGHEGGAGFAERAFAIAPAWLQATREAIASCTCETGCPSCIQSPKCGNGNNPLSKEGAVTLLDILLAKAD